MDVEKVKELRDSGLGASAIAKELGDRKSECLSGTGVVEVYLTFTPFLQIPLDFNLPSL